MVFYFGGSLAIGAGMSEVGTGGWFANIKNDNGKLILETRSYLSYEAGAGTPSFGVYAHVCRRHKCI